MIDTHIELFENLVKNKQKRSLKGINKKCRKYVIDRYKEYVNIVTHFDSNNSTRDFEELAHSNYCNKKLPGKSLCKFYTTKNKHLKPIKDLIEIKGFCGYCLLMGFADLTIEHFLPSSVYPEYSVLSLNLSYVCNRCNEIKGNRARFPDGSMQFKDPNSKNYVADILTNVHISLESKDSALILNFDSSDDSETIHKSHFTELGFSNHWAKYIPKILDIHITSSISTLLVSNMALTSYVDKLVLITNTFHENWMKTNPILGLTMKRVLCEYEDIYRQCLAEKVQRHPGYIQKMSNESS